MKRHLLTFVALVCSLMVSAYDFEKDLIYYNITSETDLTVEVTSSRSFSENHIYSWQGAAGGAAEKGGVATGHGACEGRVNYANGDYYTLSVSGKKANIDTDYILITLDQPLEANDKLEITAYRNKDTDANGTLYILFENGQTIDEGGAVVWNNVALGQEPNTNSYNVGEGAGSKTIKLVRSATSTNVFITKFVITRSANTSNITFADSKVKEICVANWDTNGDGELSLSEAARVTGIGQIFSYEKITSFDELQYFTSVETLTGGAFGFCSSLTNVTLPAGVTSIGRSAFFGCSSLTSVTLPAGLTSIGDDAFSYCSSLTSITLPAGVAIIETQTFAYCSSLTSITLPEGVTSIGNFTFEDCSSLTSVTLPASVTSIGTGTFWDCSSLTSITLPAGLTSIGDDAFWGCNKLTTVTVGNATPAALVSGDVFSNRSNATLYVPAGSKAAYESASVWSEFKEIVEIENITFADSMMKAICVARWDTNGDGELSPSEAARVTTIGTFEGNGKITSFDEFQYFTSVETLSKSAFQGCSSLMSITLPASVTSIGDYVFFGCSSLTSITLPEGVTSIGEYAFRDCSSLTSVTLPAGLTSIGEWAFFDCSSLTSITLPAGLTSIESGAFNGCSSLTSLTLPAGVTSIGRSAFFGCSSLTSVTLPAGLTSIGNYAFSYCSSLTSVTLPAGLTSIGVEAFQGCSSLTNITLPAGLTSIESGAFKDCSSLTSLTLPAGVTSIEYGAFRGCNNLKTVINLSALDIVKGSDTHGHVAYYADKVLTPGVYLDHTELTMQEDEKSVLEATVIPEGPVTWSSSDETVATVKDGVVTTLKPGEVTITAKAGEQTAICVITVKAKEVIVNPEEAFYSWQGAAGGATEKGGVATGHGACEGRVNYANGDYYTLSVSGKKANIDTDYILITLDQPLEANDKLEITAYRNKDTDANGTLYILFENGQAIDEGGEVVWNNVALGQEPNTNSYNVGGGAGSKTIKLSRSATSTNVFITKFVITRSANGIEEVEVVVPAENIIYNLQGQKLNTNSTQGLPRGLYIINGKKVLVK